MKDTVSRYIGLTGLVLLVLGSLLLAVRHPQREFIAVLFSAGGVLVFATVILNVRALSAFTRKRSARHGANSLLLTILFTAILVVAQAISIRHTSQYDFTRNKRFTLALQTLALLDRLEKDVKITAFFRKNTAQRFRAEDLLSLYQLQSGLISYEIVDPDQRPQVADALRAGYGNVVVERGTHRRLITELTEEKLTNAIVLVTRETRKTLYFVSGHGEKNIAGRDRDGYSLARQKLQDEGYLVHALSLVDAERVPADCEVLVVAGPRKNYLSSETDKISSYLAGGGDAMFLLDPRFSFPNLAAVLREYRVVLDDMVLLDELVIVDAGEEVFDATVTKIRRYEKHPITDDFRVITLFPMARPVRVIQGDQRAGVSGQYLALTEKSAWGETDLDNFGSGRSTRDTTDVSGPLPVALAAERKIPSADSTASYPGSSGGDSKIVVVGDSDFITNSFFGVLGNGDFFLNAVGFLAEDEDLIAIRLKKGLGDQIFITAAQGRLIFVLCLVLLPLSVVSVGTYVFLKRRKA